MFAALEFLVCSARADAVFCRVPVYSGTVLSLLKILL